MAGRRVLAGMENPVIFTLSAVVMGLLPVGILIGCFEGFVPQNLLADQLGPSSPAGPVDLIRYSLFITVGGVHVLLCAAICFLSLRNVAARLDSVDFRKVLLRGVIAPFAVITFLFLMFCSFDSKLYRISFERVVNVVRASPDFAYQFDMCFRHPALWIFCADGNFHLSLYSFVLIIFGLAATLSACADVGVSHFHHRKGLTSKRLAVSGNEMHNDMNRHAASLLLTLASSSIAISIFQQIGSTVFPTKSSQLESFVAAGQTASLFWPIAFSSVFIGIFALPASSIMKKRTEALRLLDASEISVADYESFFAIKEAFPQSLRWAMMSGIPLAASFAPKLIGLAG